VGDSLNKEDTSVPRGYEKAHKWKKPRLKKETKIIEKRIFNLKCDLSEKKRAKKKVVKKIDHWRNNFPAEKLEQGVAAVEIKLLEQRNTDMTDNIKTIQVKLNFENNTLDFLESVRSGTFT
jgi:hypothetical protein